jgi:hypothetical protein
VRGKTAKRIRRLARRQLFVANLTGQVPVANSPGEAEYQLRRVSKALKRLWKQGSNPRSLQWVDSWKQSRNNSLIIADESSNFTWNDRSSETPPSTSLTSEGQ